MSAPNETLHAIVYGRVQGVSFRAYAVEQARQLRLNGWVRNRTDGTVETVAVGPRGALDSYVNWLHRGPPSANVKRVEATITDAAGSGEAYTSFEVRYGD